MHSITCGIGYILAILVVNVFSSDYYVLSEPNETFERSIPFNFHYKISHNFLIMEIILKNISPSVTAVHLKYTSYDYNQYTYTWYPVEQRVNLEKPTSEVKFLILKHLKYYHIMVDLELLSQSGICDTTNIAEGRDETSLTPNWEYGYKDINNKHYSKAVYCLVPEPCAIIVDLKDKCQVSETLPSCNIEKSQYICKFTKQQTTFHQTNEDGSSIGPAQEIDMRTTKLIIKLELFDNNTSVKIATTKNEPKWDKKLSFTAEDINSEDYGSLPKQRYSETTVVEYSCTKSKKYETYIKVHVGLINTTYNKINTLNTKLIKEKFKMADNGTILCCIYYNYGRYAKEVDILTRFVENKTLLFYESIPTNHTESKGQTQALLANWWIYFVPTFLGISVLLLALYIIKQRHCCTNSQPAEETVELDNSATQHQVLYANLAFVRDGHQPENQHEESPYANIIGSLHPH